MASSSTASRVPAAVLDHTVRTEGRPLFVVSDLHLGCPPGFGFPTDLEPALADAIATQSGRGAIVVLNGDIVEDGQSASTLGTLARYPRLLEAIADACQSGGGLYYVAGNHDPAPEDLRGDLPWRVVPGLVVDDHILVVHGDVFDAGLHGTSAGRAARFHASAERCLGVPINLPIATHDTVRNRVIVGLGAGTADLARRVGLRAWVDDNLDYLASLDIGRDPRFVVAGVANALLPPSIDTIVAGHTHKPGEARAGRFRYLNCGAWSPHMATALVWQDDDGEVRDLVRGTMHGPSAYEDWDEPQSWTQWWHDAKKDLSVPRVVGRRVRHTLTSIVERRDDHPPRQARLALTGECSEDTMIVRFEERLQGALLRGHSHHTPIALNLVGATQPGFLRSCLVDLEGTIDVEGFARGKAAIGTLRLSARTWDYDIAFCGDDQRPYRLVVRKRIRALDLVESLTVAQGDIFGGRGRSIGSVELRFEIDRDLGPLIRSFTTRADSEPSSTFGTGAAPIIDDPQPWAPLAEAAERTVAVTGASGHLGFTLASQLCTRGYRVLGLVRDTTDHRADALRALGVDVREVDVLSLPSLTRALDGTSTEGLFHTAAPFLLWAKDDERDIVAPMVDGCLNAMHAAVGCGIQRVVLTSAGGAVGHDASGRDALHEGDWNREPRSPYLRGKTQAERSAWEFARHHGVDLVTVLPTAILGPNFHNHTPVTQLLSDIVEGKVPALPDFAHSWVDVRDVARAHVLAFESPAATGRYIVSATYKSWRAMIDSLHAIDSRVARPPRLPNAAIPLLPVFDGLRSRVLGSKRSLTRAVVDELHGREPRYDATRARRDLGLDFIDFERTLTDTLRWLEYRRTSAAPPSTGGLA